MAKPVDLELKKAFVELQVQMVETTKKIHTIDAQIDILKTYLHGADHDITQREIRTLPPGTKTYEPDGRMFVVNEVSGIQGIFLNRISVLAARRSELEKTKQYLEKNLKESEDNIREMVQQRKEQTDLK